MWVFEHGDALKCMLSSLDAYSDFVDNVPFCSTITALACIGVTHSPDKKEINFTVTRNVSDFAKKKSYLKDLLNIAIMAKDKDLNIQNVWELRKNHPIDTVRWPNVAKVEFIVFNNIEEIKDSMIDCLLGEVHTLFDGRQYLVPRFALLKTKDDSLKISEIVYSQQENQLQNNTVTYCTINDPRTQETVSLTLTYPLYPTTE